MIVAHEVVSAASQMATSALAAALWQGALLAGAAALGLRLLPETPAPVRFSIWFAVFLLVAALPFATVSLAHGGAGAAASSSHPWLTVDARWCVWIAAIWAAASLVRGITLVAAAFRVRALWKRAEPLRLVGLANGFSGRKNTEILRCAQDDTSKGSAIARNAQVCVSDEVDRPTVIGFFSPKIVIPGWLIGKLRPEELEQVVLHEAGHLSRRDDWLNLLQKIALVIFPLNPALAWVERRLCFERELACDESVLNATGAPKAYAECLAALAEYRLQRRGLVRGLALALGALGRESELTQRVLRILSGGRRMKRSHARMVLGGATLSLVFAATALERSPQIVGFTHASVPANEVRDLSAIGMRAMAVRASVTPAEQSKSIGDAPPRMAKRIVQTRAARSSDAVVEGPAMTSAAKAVMVEADVSGTAKAVPLSKTGLSTTDRAVMSGANVDRFRPEAVAAHVTNTEVLPLRAAQGQDDTVERNSGAAGPGPRMVRTVATTRQVSEEGDVVVTRWVSVTSWDSNRSDGSTQPAQGAQRPSAAVQQQQIVRRYAAVPVQGGWLVFQL
jgi:beta-lactamase regulating signal transducer with metallopeptidase domain